MPQTPGSVKGIEYVKGKEIEESPDNSKDLSKLVFKKGTQFDQKFLLKFNLTHFSGIQTFAAMLHTEESKDFKAYNSWNFSESYLWDSIK